MAIYRNVQMSFWTDRKIDEDFKPEDKYMYLFFLTNPLTNLCGCYEIGRKQAAKLTGLSLGQVADTMARLEKQHKVILYSDKTGEILVMNWSKYNWINSEKFRKPLLAEIQAVKDDTFKAYLLDLFNGVDTVSIPYPYGMDTTVTDTVTVNNNKYIKTNSKKKPPNKWQPKDQRQYDYDKLENQLRGCYG